MPTRKRKNQWFVDFTFRYRRYRIKSPENSRAGAQAYEATLRKRLSNGEKIDASLPTPPVDSVTIRVFAEQWFETYVKPNNKYSEIITKRSILDCRIIPFFGDYAVGSIPSRAVEEFKVWCQKEGVQNKTINNYLAVLSRCLKSAHEWGLIETIPYIRRLKVPPTLTRYLTPEELIRLLQVVGEHWREIIFFFVRTGLRFGELIALQWSDVNIEEGVLTVQRNIVRGRICSPKSNKIRRVPFDEDVKQLLNNKTKNGPYVFTDTHGLVIKQKGCDKAILRFGRMAGLGRVTWHMSRHSYASHLANNGISIQVIQALLGHSDIKTTMRYSHLASAPLVDAVRSLPQCSVPFWSPGGHKVESESVRNLASI